MKANKTNETKVYRYPKGYYLISILGPNIMMVILLIWSMYERFLGNHTAINQLVVTVVPLLLFCSFIAMNQPSTIEDDDEKVILYGFWQKHEYKWSEIKFLRIRKFMMTDRVYVRIGKERVLRGRYWIDVDSMNGVNELLEKMVAYDLKYDEYNRIGKKKKQGKKTVRS